MGTLKHDLLGGLRTFLRRPRFAALVTGTLALGIGAHAALFSAVDRVLLRPVDLPAPDELVVVRMRVDGELRNLTGPNAVDLLRESEDVFAAATGFWGAGAPLESPDGSRELRPGVGATSGVFETLGVPLQLGRPWGPEADGTGVWSDVVITDRLWRNRFGADTALAGSTILLNGGPVRVDGVMASGFEFPTLESADFVFPPVVGDLSTISRAGLGAFTILARLSPGMTLERAREEVEAIWEGLRTTYPGDLLDHGVAVMSLQDYMVRDARPPLLALLGATSLLLLLACANVANLMLARGMGRSAEMSIRASLGAGRGRLVRQLLAESAVLAAVAGVAGILLAQGSLGAVRALAPPEIPGIDEVRLSVRALGFALALAMGCVVAVGILPAARTATADLSGALRGGSHASPGWRLRRLQRALVVAQVSAAVVLTVGAGLLVRSFARLSVVDPGYRTEGVLTASIGAPQDIYTDRSSRAALIRRIEQAVAALPGVLHVGTTLRPPFSSGELSTPVRLEGGEGTLDDAPRAEIGIVSGGYIEALEIPVLRGRNFGPQEWGESPRAALLSADLARRLYGEADPIGRRLTPVLGAWERATNWAEVVGVVGDIRLQSLDAAAAGTLYLATEQMPQPGGTVVLRTSGDPARLAGDVRAALLRVEPKLTAPSIETLASLRSESLARPRFSSLLAGTFSFLALILAVVGVYGLLSYSVARRRIELGVRVALGADRSSVLLLVMQEGMGFVAVGLLIGVGAALMAGRALSALLFEVAPDDPTTYGSVIIGVVAVALAGCLLPALRAADADGLGALRRD